MEKYYIATGKTIDLAIQAALTQLQLDRDSVSVEVLENAKSGFLGIGASPAKVKVTYEVPDEVDIPTPALSSASRSKPKKKDKPAEAKVVDLPKAAPRPEAPKSAPQPAPRPAPEKPARAERPERPARAEQPRRSDERRGEPRRDGRKKQQSRSPRPDRAPAAPKVVKEYAPAEPGSTEERIEQFIKGLLEHMGSDAVPHAERTGEDTFSVELVGENLGMLIGRRGDTLDAIQHLTHYTINRDASKRSRINVDAESYRAKREESLQRLAHKVAGKVVRYRRNITLEPMNAYERHVIHAALQDAPDVTTFSTGTEPNRRVVVSYTRYKPQPTSGETQE